MQEASPYASKRRVGCVMWLAIVTLIISLFGLVLDITQEMAWNGRMEELTALEARLSSLPIANAPVASPDEPAPTEPTRSAVVISPSESRSINNAPVDNAPINNTPAPSVSSSGVTYEQICGVNESNMTDPQLEAHARSFEGQSFNGWQGWVYDVVSRSNGSYNLEIAMQERGLFWSRDVVIENIPTEWAMRLNVEQPLVFSGRVARVDYTFEVMCNPMTVDNFSSPSLPAAAVAAVIETQSTPTPDATWTPVPARMNTDVIVDDILWFASSVQEVGQELVDPDGYQENATTGGKFVRVTMRVENRRNAPTTSYDAPDLVDIQGRRFRAYDRRFYYLPSEESCSSEVFNPSIMRTCTEIYEVAADSAGHYTLIVNNFESYDAIEALIEMR